MRKYLVLLVILIFVIVGGWVFFAHHNASEKSVLSATQTQKALETILGRSPQLTEKVYSNQTKLFTGTYVSFAYPVWANVYEIHPQAPVIDAFSFGLVDQHATLTIQSIVDPRATSAKDFSAVTVRLSQPSLYTQTLTTSNSVACLQFSKTDTTEQQSEQSLFCFKNGVLISLVASGSRIDEITKYFHEIVSSLVF